MKKVKYYKKNTDRKKHWFSESWGEPLDVVLPNGKVLHFACEFYRGDGWYITDRETGLLSQNKHIPNKNELTKYLKDENFLKALSRIMDSGYYQKQKDELSLFLKKTGENIV